MPPKKRKQSQKNKGKNKQKRKKTTNSETTPEVPETKENLEFEEQFEDEFEEENIVDGKSISEMNLDESDEEESATQFWNPQSAPLEPDQGLEYDSRAYVMHHILRSEWPCLSFDILKDELGMQRTRFPHSMFLVGGTQAAELQNNKIIIFKLSDLQKTSFDDDSEDEDESASEGDPVCEFKFINTPDGETNRIRSMPQNEAIVAQYIFCFLARILNLSQLSLQRWSSSSSINMYDISEELKGLKTIGYVAPAQKRNARIKEIKKHTTEGFAMDWSNVTPGRLATGDNKGDIFVFEPNEGSWDTTGSAFIGHSVNTGVEDIQWSPNEAEVMASSGCDQTIRIWDTRKRTGSAFSIKAHDSDINVISWNPLVPYLLASGADNGDFKTWDLRYIKNQEHLSEYKWHTKPITSIEWSPHEDSVLAVSEDDQITIWDFSVEPDFESMSDVTKQKQIENKDIPEQLMFVHRGQSDIKELHWHKQIPGTMISTALEFNVFQPNMVVEQED